MAHEGRLSAFKVLGRNIVNLVYPMHCQICAVPLDPLNKYYLCERCISQIRPCPEPNYKKFDALTVYSATVYEGILRECIHMFKYNRKKYLSALITKIMRDFVERNTKILDGVDLITAVPLHARKLRRREFNQSEVLAGSLSKELGIPFRRLLLKRKRTRPQSDLSKQERLENVKGAFGIKDASVGGRARIAGRGILIVDDVLTTGSTLKECARVLTRFGAARVLGLTLARGLKA